MLRRLPVQTLLGGLKKAARPLVSPTLAARPLLSQRFRSTAILDHDVGDDRDFTESFLDVVSR